MFQITCDEYGNKWTAIIYSDENLDRLCLEDLSWLFDENIIQIKQI
jgi:hypothetical protein